MAQVDPENDSIRRFIVQHYRYDPERRERRQVVVAAFDNKREYRRFLEATAAEISRRKDAGAAEPDSMFREWSGNPATSAGSRTHG